MEVCFARNIGFEGGDYGNAVLSRLPVVGFENTLLPVIDGEERKGALQVVVEQAGRRILFINTHLDHRPGEADHLPLIADLEIRVFSERAGQERQ